MGQNQSKFDRNAAIQDAQDQKPTRREARIVRDLVKEFCNAPEKHLAENKKHIRAFIWANLDDLVNWRTGQVDRRRIQQEHLAFLEAKHAETLGELEALVKEAEEAKEATEAEEGGESNVQ